MISFFKENPALAVQNLKVKKKNQLHEYKITKFLENLRHLKVSALTENVFLKENLEVMR